MSNTCKKCGHEIDGNSPICMYCGTAVADANITEETKARMTEENKKTASDNTGTFLKAFGALLCIAGFIADVVSMFLVFSDGYELFSAFTIGGTIAFLLGLAIVSNT